MRQLAQLCHGIGNGADLIVIEVKMRQFSWFVEIGLRV